MIFVYNLNDDVYIMLRYYIIWIILLYYIICDFYIILLFMYFLYN